MTNFENADYFWCLYFQEWAWSQLFSHAIPHINSLLRRAWTTATEKAEQRRSKHLVRRSLSTFPRTEDSTSSTVILFAWLLLWIFDKYEFIKYGNIHKLLQILLPLDALHQWHINGWEHQTTVVISIFTLLSLSTSPISERERLVSSPFPVSIPLLVDFIVLYRIWSAREERIESEKHFICLFMHLKT